MKVGLDTCSGVNLIRRSQIPYGAKIRRAPGVTNFKAAQGQKVEMIGEVTLSLTVVGSSDPVAVDFVVVDALVVPALLGTPWIDKYVWRIDPPKRTVLLQFDEQKEPFKTQLTTAPKRIHHPLRASSEQTLPPFSETWVSCNTHATGMSLIRPSRLCDHLLQANNGVKTLPPNRGTFLA